MRTRHTVIVLISGKAGAGKTTTKDILKTKLLSLEDLSVGEYSFASPIKVAAKLFFFWKGTKDESGRELLQVLGMAGRSYDEDVWVKHFLKFLDKSGSVFPHNFVIIDDWRFPNEAEFLKKNPLFRVETVRIVGRGGLHGNLANDASEVSLPEDLEAYDCVINNIGTMDELSKNVDSVVEYVKNKYIIE